MSAVKHAATFGTLRAIWRALGLSMEGVMRFTNSQDWTLTDPTGTNSARCGVRSARGGGRVTRLLWFWVLLGMSFISACSPAGGQPISHRAAPTQPCSLGTLQVGPEGFAPYGIARAGPLWFSAFGRVDPGSPATLAPGGGPFDGWKVVIHPDASATGTASLTGSQCSTGKAVRFCYSSTGCDWASRLQSSVTTLPVNVSDHLDDTGYMVFPGPGLMRLSTRDSRDIVSTVVIAVPSPSIQ
jgi:hypothetical protein